MVEKTAGAPLRNRSLPAGLIFLAIGLGLFALNVFLSGQAAALPHLPDKAAAGDLVALQLLYATLPRLVVALAAGGLLGLAAALMRQALQNPLAEPGTLGLLSAARLAVAVSLIWFPSLSGLRGPVLLGCGIALFFVLGFSAIRRFSPLFVILNGMILGLCLDATTSMLILTHFEELGELMIWQTGSLIQDNWQAATLLPLCLLVAGLATFFLRRPFGWLDFEEATMRGVGLSPALIRSLALIAATAAAAAVTVETGVIAFVGLAGAALASAFGSRRFGERAGYAALFGGAMLLVTDQAVQMAEGILPVPAGAVTALFGAPVLLVLLRKGRPAMPANNQKAPASIAIPRTRGGLAAGLVVFGAILIAALCIGRTPAGLAFANGQDFLLLFEFRWPRLLAAMASGGLLAFAGCLMQRMTGNDLASPELLGVSSGAALTMLPVILLLPPLDRSETMLIAAAGALLFLLLSLRLSVRSGFAPERLLLSGLAVTALAGSLLSVVAFLGDPRLVKLLGWLSGSTYRVQPGDALLTAGVLLLALATSPLIGRWLGLLPLGEATGRALGLRVKPARFTLVLMTALVTGTATVMIGPVSFVGLIAPHLARLSGLRTPLAQLFGAVCVGAAMMALADWLGRILAFPWELPAGLVVTVIGAIVYAGLMVRR